MPWPSCVSVCPSQVRVLFKLLKGSSTCLAQSLRAAGLSYIVLEGNSGICKNMITSRDNLEVDFQLTVWSTAWMRRGNWAGIGKQCTVASPGFGVRGGTTIEAPKARASRRRVGWVCGGVSAPQPTRGPWGASWAPPARSGQSPGRYRIFCIF